MLLRNSRHTSACHRSTTRDAVFSGQKALLGRPKPITSKTHLRLPHHDSVSLSCKTGRHPHGQTQAKSQCIQYFLFERAETPPKGASYHEYQKVSGLAFARFTTTRIQGVATRNTIDSSLIVMPFFSLSFAVCTAVAMERSPSWI